MANKFKNLTIEQDCRIVDFHGLSISIPVDARFVAFDKNGEIHSYTNRPYVSDIIWDYDEGSHEYVGEVTSRKYLKYWKNSLVEVK